MTELKQKKLIDIILNQCIKIKHPQTKESLYQIKDISVLCDEIDSFYVRSKPKNE